MASNQPLPTDDSTRLSREFDADFAPGEDYTHELPDTQNLKSAEIPGTPVAIQEVGSSNFRLPMRFQNADGTEIQLEVSVFGGVSLDANRKGINMSRIIRIFYEHRNQILNFGLIRKVLENYREKLDAESARLQVRFSLPLAQKSLRSGLDGFQYYDTVLEGRMSSGGEYTRMMQIGFVYSSACPCSSDLADHAEETRQRYAIPHSQRSRAQVKVVPISDESVTIEGLVALCRDALATETQSMVRRVDEQAFAELNGAYQKFVEDAVRLLYSQIDAHPGIEKFAVSCSHLESLHSHDAVASIAKGLPTGLSGAIENYNDLIC
ncbi:MAG: GTP cyclohydrolase FolE2 [Verrucomicrobiota bacterium]